MPTISTWQTDSHRTSHPKEAYSGIMFVTHIPLASPVQMRSGFNLVSPDWWSPPAWEQDALLRFLLISSRESLGVLYMGSQPSACPQLSLSCSPLIPVLDMHWCCPCHIDFKVSYSFVTGLSTDTDLSLNSPQPYWNWVLMLTKTLLEAQETEEITEEKLTTGY